MEPEIIESLPEPPPPTLQQAIEAHEEACLAALRPILEAYGCELYAAPQLVGELYLLRVGVRLRRP